MRMKYFLATSVLSVLLAVSVAPAFADDDMEARAILGGTPFANANYGNNVIRGRATLTSREDGART